MVVKSATKKRLMELGVSEEFAHKLATDRNMTDIKTLSHDEIASILDWELSTLVDPVAYFSYHCLRYTDNPVISNNENCLNLGIPTFQEYVKMYFENSEFEVSDDEWNLYMAFNMFKIAAILQGITGRVRDGTAAGKDADKLFPQTVELANNAWNLINS